ncbi:MAG: hypothetical protein RL722_2595 [Pseudomonadota bacterium]|jgi:C-terminal processing protease CtpA/Prc
MPAIARIALLLICALCWGRASAAAEAGYIGMGLDVNGDGFFLNPTLTAVKVSKVVAASPAAKAGISEGDHIVEVEGRQVIGAKANDLKPLLEREAGQSIRFVIKKPSGELKQVTVVTGPRP